MIPDIHQYDNYYNLLNEKSLNFWAIQKYLYNNYQ
jgi:hypothetical protein